MSTFSFAPYRFFITGAALAGAMACGSDSTGPQTAPGFLGGTSDNHEIALIANSTGKALTMFQLGSPSTQAQVALGTSSTVTPTGLSVQGRRAAVPLGNAASVALINLETASIQRVFTFASGNATGSAFADDTTIIAANTSLNLVGRFTTGQTSEAITQTASVAPQPSAVVASNGRAMVISANLDANYKAIGNGIVTILDAKTLAVLGTVSTGGTNSTAAAIGPDGLLYVVNTTVNYDGGSVTIINPSTAEVVATVGGMGAGPGAISIDSNGLAYISGFYFGTLVWNTKTHAFVRGPENPVCAKLASGECRGAFAATTSANGNLYQLFFGDVTHGHPPYAFVYKGSSFTLSDSVSVGSGPAAIAIRSF